MYRFSPRTFWTGALTAFALLLAAAGPGGVTPARAAATPLNNVWVADGPVYSSALSGTTLYIGGSFNFVGPQTGGGTFIDTVSAAPLQFPVVSGSVLAVVPDGVGGLYIGGLFTQVGQTAVNNLAHITPDQSGKFLVDTAFTPAVTSSTATATVWSLALSGTTLYVGGTFDAVDGTARNNIAALNTGGGTVIGGWDPNADDTVRALALSGSTLFVGGAFANIGGAARNGLAAIDADPTGAGAAVAGWDAAAAPGSQIYAMTLDSGGVSLYLGGSFTTVGGAARSNIAKVNAADGSLVTDWNPGANAAVETLRLDSQAGGLFVGGLFNTATLPSPSLGGAARQYLGRLDPASGEVDTQWTPATDGPVYSLDIIGSSVFVGGLFNTISGSKRHNIAGVTGLTSYSVSTWDPGTSGTVGLISAVTLPGGTYLFSGGSFVSAGGKVRSGAAALDTTTGSATGWDPQANGTVIAIVPSAGAIFLGGSFTTMGGHSRNYFAAVDGTAGQVLSSGWDVSFNAPVISMLLNGTTLYVGGGFTQVGADPRQRLAAFDTQSAALMPWAPLVDNGTVWTLAQYTDESTSVYFGGSFTSVGGVGRNRLAAVDGSTGALLDWNPNVDAGNAVYSIALSSGSDTDDAPGLADSSDTPPVLYVGGDFTHLAGAARSDIAALTTDDTGTLVSWDANADNADGPVYRLALSPDQTVLYVGGRFTAIGGQQARTALTALTASDGKATAWDPELNGGDSTRFDPTVSGGGPWVGALTASSAGRLYAGGNYSLMGGQAQFLFSAFQAPTSTATPPGGPYPSARSVILACTDKDGNDCTNNVLYSTDGSTPSTPYASGAQIPINTTGTLKYFAVDSEGMRENINTDSYIIDGDAPTVSANPPGGTFTAQQNVVLTCTDTGGSNCAHIYYTTDGSTPSVNSTAYTAAVALTGNTVLKFIALDGAGNASAVTQATFIIDSLAPVTTPSPAAGTYTTPQTVTLSCDDGAEGFGCAATYYTLDGSVPNLASPRYTGPLLIDQNATLNYFSTDNAGHQEGAHSAVYLIQTGQVVTSGGGVIAPRVLLGLLALAVLRRRGRRRW